MGAHARDGDAVGNGHLYEKGAIPEVLMQVCSMYSIWYGMVWEYRCACVCVCVFVCLCMCTYVYV